MALTHLAKFLILCAVTASVSHVQAEPSKNIVLVHGAFADGSGWKGVAERLVAEGHKVSVVQHPNSTLAEDVAAVRRVLDMQDGAVVLVGHSYGGTVITEAGNHPKVKSLVYVAALAPDSGENARELRAKRPPVTTNVVQVGDGFIIRDPATFVADFAADLPKDVAAFMAISQVPTSTKALTSAVTTAAWRSRPSWYVVATEDRIINPELQRFMAQRAGSKTVEIKGSHVVFMAQPAAVAKVIKDAAQ
jgi:pimeloyl-ACP methyl ester carboxylesterase